MQVGHAPHCIGKPGILQDLDISDCLRNRTVFANKSEHIRIKT